ncbi:indole-3-glycerol phosphate synthase [Candidatus Falkowbacteria bacterium CG11_big_fil_rev_8_21_14_0_20_39_10]|uniref:indole-3-glycerol-phosphate synthase n=1 Tax=Candidatus Falkowbacteria bacterium CG11_big_fil_rev_8_21_14_0_20_39_10 TaxID=1974570 RepID=A0A2M6K962_9BACT|nr:MAG: indole-3-glycerol phosphate synthase [Candidatus Falkowbacteria bacterium CG11_big_fil_rev_8_21_14_0_20_39_10]
MGILKKIIASKKQEVETSKQKKNLKQMQKECCAYLENKKINGYPKSFKHALLNGKPLGLIAEIKLASPSTGQLTSMKYDDIARQYADSRADVISILTDEKYFHGHISYLEKVKQICQQPIFRKDFIVDFYQIYETALAAADAYLLIASILTVDEIKNFIQLGKELDLECLVETHDEEDLKKALKANAEIIGINNRNLKTMKIDLGTTKKLASIIPKGKIIISESGINTHDEVKKLITFGIKGILVGTSIIKSKNIIEKINELKH